jgi:exopolyphosphatase/guanosine-5'-triphosphate,3'-diphosphate pyrophosphatase
VASSHPHRLATIDIGTNSIKLLVADVVNGRVKTRTFRRKTTRIGTGLERSGRIRRDRLSASIDVIAAFERTARREGASHTFAFSTFALRKAVNARETLARIARETGMSVRVISGREEARFAYLSARARLVRPRPGTLMLDIGGGSLELALSLSGSVVRASSLPLGALLLTERFISTDPIDPAEYAALGRHANRHLSRWFKASPVPHPGRLDVVASGGSITTLSDMTHPTGRSSGRISDHELHRLESRCLALTIAGRKRIRGLPSDRADIIPAGIAVVRTVLRLSRKRVVTVNEGGVREGVLIHLSENRLRW